MKPFTFVNGSYGDGSAHIRFLINFSNGSGGDAFTQAGSTSAIHGVSDP